MACLLEEGSAVVVVSKGDPGLTEFGSCEGWHFPRTADGKYAGHHPADGADAVAQLEQLRGQGARYFLLPTTYSWWLTHYEELARHVRSRYRLVADCPGTCVIYDLHAGPVATEAPAPSSPESRAPAARNPLVPAIRALLDSLLPDQEPVLVVTNGDDELLGLGRTAVRFPGDGARYLVVPKAGSAPPEVRDRARTVATRAGVCALYELEDARGE